MWEKDSCKNKLARQNPLRGSTPDICTVYSYKKGKRDIAKYRVASRGVDRGGRGGSSPIKVETNFDKGAKNLPPPFPLIIFNFYPEFPDSCLFDASDIYS